MENRFFLLNDTISFFDHESEEYLTGKVVGRTFGEDAKYDISTESGVYLNVGGEQIEKQYRRN